MYVSWSQGGRSEFNTSSDKRRSRHKCTADLEREKPTKKQQDVVINATSVGDQSKGGLAVATQV